MKKHLRIIGSSPIVSLLVVPPEKHSGIGSPLDNVILQDMIVKQYKDITPTEKDSDLATLERTGPYTQDLISPPADRLPTHEE